MFYLPTRTKESDMMLDLSPAQADALATLLGATGGNDDLDHIYDALVDRGAEDTQAVTFSVNEDRAEFGGPEFVIHVA